MPQLISIRFLGKNFEECDKNCLICLLALPQEQKGGEHMSPSDRRQALLEALYQRRQDTCENLAFEFQVSRRTICRDIAILMCSYPIETSRGYGGCVKITDGHYRGQKLLTYDQAQLLIRLKDQVSEKDREILDSILIQFAP